MNGILAVNKPVGITSYDVIRKIKRTGYKGKLGHGGTLDPFASGVLLILFGKGTKKFDEIQKMKKSYRAVAKIGSSTDTLDLEGEEVEKSDNVNVNKRKIEEIVSRYIGKIKQEIPQYSAAKYKGRPMYKAARAGEEIPRRFKQVEIFDIKTEELDGKVIFDVTCSSGTYIRQLSYDILKEAGYLSHLVELERKSIGSFNIKSSVSMEDIEEGSWEKLLVK